jgi:hypothetical protein
MIRKGDRGESKRKVNIYNKDKIMLAKIERWEQKKKIMLNKSKLQERKDINDDLTNKERKTKEVKRDG